MHSASDPKNIRFNRPHLVDREQTYLEEVLAKGHYAGDGDFTRRCHHWLEAQTGASAALLTHSCTAALEMSALLLDFGPGDEVIMPSFTFVSTANAFVLRGATPVFVDIRPDTLNLDEQLIEAAITSRTKAIVPVHYAGVSCDMDPILALAARRGLGVVEDAAQGLLASYKGRALGTLGHLGTLSFHETKNVVSGEGGALLVNDQNLERRAEIIREKGTDRSLFLRGEVDKYTWREVGSSFLPGELTAAFLLAQLEHAEAITAERRLLWARYHDLLEPLERDGLLRRPIVPDDCEHNGHLYYVLVDQQAKRGDVLAHMKASGIGSTFHYIPLHSSPAGQRYGRVHGELSVTEDSASRLVRLPMWVGLDAAGQNRVVEALAQAVRTN